MPYLIIHGHFYQPPRENPWTDEIDREPTAAPYHDWNDRINDECYRANAFARVLAADGRVVDILNNYEYLSFNFGPTLLSWVRQHAPDVYARLREGDQQSRRRLQHGNAIAQVYSHSIMPLAHPRDQETQVQWGLTDFKHHFGREAEAMWLAETAVDLPTLDVLAAHGLRYAILAPSQAARVRHLTRREWVDVSHGQIDPTRAYVCRLPSGRSINLFFYDGPLSRDMGYGDLARDSWALVNRFRQAVNPARPHPDRQLIHTATDGETFGHHKKFAERTLIYAFTHAAPQHGFQVTNYGAYLSAHPAEWEVEIKPNTAWSCAHGLGRWSANCGCHTGGEPHWHQRWRAPLREALDHVREALAEIYQREATPLLGDPWLARNAYGALLTERDPDRVAAFLHHHANRTLTPEEQTTALTLLEMQRHTLLMYASCGWFFNDISGIETAQILKYAARAIDLASRFTATDKLTIRLLTDLARATGNTAEFPTGADVYERKVLPVAIGPEKVVANHAIRALVAPLPELYHRHAYKVEQERHLSRLEGDYDLVAGYLHLTSDFTGRHSHWVYAALYLGGYNFTASVAPCESPAAAEALINQLNSPIAEPVHMVDLIALYQTTFGPILFTLADLAPRDRRRVMEEHDRERLAEVAESYDLIYNQHLGSIAALRDAELPVPPELRLAAEFSLSHRLNRAARAFAHDPNPDTEAAFGQVLALAAQAGLHLDRRDSTLMLEQAVVDGVHQLVNTPSSDERLARYQRLSRLITAASRFGYEARPARAQALLLEFLRQRIQVWGPTPADRLALRQNPPPVLAAALQLADSLWLSQEAMWAKS